MKISNKISNRFFLISIFAGLTMFSILGFTNSNIDKENGKNEYLTIVVEYDMLSQSITVSEGAKEIKSYAHLINGLSKKQKKRFVGKNTIVKEGKSFKTFDNRFVHELINNFEEEGWNLNSHNFSLGKSSSAIKDVGLLGEDEINESTEYISYFLFSRSVIE